jgi:hypothetical protein
MANKKNWLAMPIMVLVLGLVMIGCPDPNDTTGPTVETYTGTADGQTYTLKITDDKTYELTIGSKKSSGSAAKNGGMYTLTPSNAASVTFTVTKSGNNITSMSGTITFIDNDTEAAPTTLTPLSTQPVLTIANVASNTTVRITTQTITSDTAFDSLSGVVATGQGTYPYLTWTGKTLTGTYNVMLRLVDSPNTVKYKNEVQFIDGSATVDWNAMTTK